MQLFSYKGIRFTVTIADKCIVSDQLFFFDQFISFLKSLPVHKIKLGIYNLPIRFFLDLIKHKRRITGCGEFCSPSDSLEIMIWIFFVKFKSAMFYKELDLRTHRIPHHPDLPLFRKLFVLITLYMPVILFKKVCFIGIWSFGCIQLHIIACMNLFTFSTFRFHRMYFKGFVIQGANLTFFYQSVKSFTLFSQSVRLYPY